MIFVGATRIKQHAYWRFVSLLTFASAILSIVFFYPWLPDGGLDSSWATAISEAVDRKLVIGKDIIFSYGPFSNIWTGTYSASHHNLYLLLSLGLASLLGCHLVAIFRHRAMPWTLTLLSLSMLAFHQTAMDALLGAIPLAGTFDLATEKLNNDRRTRTGTNFRVVFSAIAIGVLPLVKINMVAICGVCAAINVILIFRKHSALAGLGYLCISFCTLCTAPLLVQQPFAGFFRYSSGTREIVLGYTQAMAWYTPNTNALLCVAGILLTGLTAMRFRAHRSLPFIAMVAYAFFMLKESFVRGDAEHVQNGALAIIFIAGLTQTHLSIKQNAKYAHLFIACLIAVAVIPIRSMTDLRRWALTNVDHVAQQAEGLKLRLVNPDYLESLHQNRLYSLYAPIRDIPLPGSTDLYNVQQNMVLLANTNWNPRPIMQSYSAYTPELARINANHLLDSKAPDNLLVHIGTIDSRLPALDDGPSWPIIFTHYKVSAITKSYAALARSSFDGRTLQHINTVQTSLEQPIDIPQVEGQLYIRLNLQQTLRGMLMQVLYKPQLVGIHILLTDGTTRDYRIIPNMARSDFLLSPLVETTQDFLDISLNKPDNKHVQRIWLYSESTVEMDWKKHFSIDFFELAQPPSMML